ncbi:MAG: hypothetical protein U5Q44_09945 [Dehalococcoidia bacterium]|nr:hypothetical protein [Dehalococcoidia bacterium]
MTRLALPTGDARASTGELLAGAGIDAPGYEPSSRVLRSTAEDETITLRIFREKDIPIQVALGQLRRRHLRRRVAHRDGPAFPAAAHRPYRRIAGTAYRPLALCFG